MWTLIQQHYIDALAGSGLTQQQVAQRAGLSAQNAISRIIRPSGGKGVTVDTFIRAIFGLGLTPVEFFDPLVRQLALLVPSPPTLPAPAPSSEVVDHVAPSSTNFDAFIVRALEQIREQQRADLDQLRQQLGLTDAEQRRLALRLDAVLGNRAGATDTASEPAASVARKRRAARRPRHLRRHRKSA
jgi:hypothetical protein